MVDPLEVPAAINATLKLIKDIQADWEVVAPQNPQLKADADNVLATWEKVLGIQKA